MQSQLSQVRMPTQRAGTERDRPHPRSAEMRPGLGLLALDRPQRATSAQTTALTLSVDAELIPPSVLLCRPDRQAPKRQEVASAVTAHLLRVLRWLQGSSAA